MAKKQKKPSHLYAIVSTTMVLFVLGLLAVLLINASKISQQLKENIEVSVALKPDTSLKESKNFQQKLKDNPWVQSTRFISKEEAAEQFEKEFGEEFTDLLGFNPLFDAVQVTLNSEYTQTDSLAKFEKQIAGLSAVDSVNYPKNIVSLINENVRKLGILLLILSGIFLFIAISLIDNTIRLSMYSKRFLIKSMQLVGATRKFITRPFVRQSLLNGLISGILACILLFAFLFAVYQNFGLFNMKSEPISYAYVGFCVILIGVLLSYWSTKSAVLKYLKMKLDELY